ncbi:hypothetical protein [Brachybacterium sp. GPGPB12]|uniref:hypothetical protein n=1 Tax=Brachybacterium sp. GPGPB12 TaxID=3023517 RepID=UPI00313456CA
MNTRAPDTVLVPLSSNAPPYRIDDVSTGDHYVRIRKVGPDVLALVPPGDDAAGFRDTLVAEPRAYSLRDIATRATTACCTRRSSSPSRWSGWRCWCACRWTSSRCFGGPSWRRPPSRSSWPHWWPTARWCSLPKVGLAHTLTSARYPADPEYAAREMSESGIRYLTEDDLRDGSAAMDALRHDVLGDPRSVRAEEWAVLWVLAARDELYGSALVTTRKLAQIRLEEIIARRSREFSAEMQVSLEDLENTPSRPRPLHRVRTTRGRRRR